MWLSRRTQRLIGGAYGLESQSSASRKRFGTPMIERGLTWFEWQELYPDKLRTRLTITFAFVVTHNHFVLDRGGKAFNRSAPVIKLSAGVTENEHLALLGVLNSSVVCFWLKQVCQNRGGTIDTRGARHEDRTIRGFLRDQRWPRQGNPASKPARRPATGVARPTCEEPGSSA